jgi:hypothetical protein
MARTVNLERSFQVVFPFAKKKKTLEVEKTVFMKRSLIISFRYVKQGKDWQRRDTPHLLDRDLN